MSDYLPPDLSHMKTDELVALMLATGASTDKSDQEFAKACSKEIAKRKPEHQGEKG
jgi:hypothetical protein